MMPGNYPCLVPGNFLVYGWRIFRTLIRAFPSRVLTERWEGNSLGLGYTDDNVDEAQGSITGALMVISDKGTGIYTREVCRG